MLVVGACEGIVDYGNNKKPELLVFTAEGPVEKGPKCHPLYERGPFEIISIDNKRSLKSNFHQISILQSIRNSSFGLHIDMLCL